MLLPAIASADTDLTVPAAQVSGITAGKQAAVYIVRMQGEPVVNYDGSVAGLAATKLKSGQRLDRNNRKVRKYVDHLKNTHSAVASAAGVSAGKFYDYAYSFNGFAAEMTPAQAASIAARADVVSVVADELRQPTTDNTPDFLGLSDPTSGLHEAWGVQGEDVIVGIIDTGIWPEHPSFSDQADFSNQTGESGQATRVYGPAPAHWRGTCQSGELFSQDDCNHKLIGARYFKEGFDHRGINTSGDYLSARDADGHGSHTASTAAGNAGVSASVMGSDLGTVTGMAPRARIAAYKVCWADSGCALSDITMAIDQAVADGVDVINFSIGSDAPVYGPDDVAFLFAGAAGVFVATSNGNSGPAPASTGAPAIDPWVTSVGASTQNRTFQGSAVLGEGAEYFGASITDGTSELQLVDAEDAGDALCNPGALDPSVVAGNIVLCLRGAIARVEKSHAVAIAGGAGMILYNSFDAQAEVTDNHWTPAVHINNTDGLVIKAYIGAQGPAAVAQIFGGVYTPAPAPFMAAFSSRGPNGGAYDIIKPDLTAPGVNILAAATPTPFVGAGGELFQAISGTSMSSPHVAGLGALLVQAHADWSPAMIKSALMTTAYQGVAKEDGATPADPFDMGAGHVQPNAAVDPGLVYHAGLFEYAGFTCGASLGIFTPGSCDFLAAIGVPLDPSDLNIASIGIADLVGSQTITRIVTSVTPGTTTYTAAFDMPADIDAVVSPATLTLAYGQSAAYTVTFTNLGAVSYLWKFGALTWSDGAHQVRSPIAVRPITFSAPTAVTGTGTAGSTSFDVVFGYDGAYDVTAHGLTLADEQSGYVVDDPANDINTALGSGVGMTIHGVVAAAGTDLLRFALFDEHTDGADDLDLYIFGPGAAGFPFMGGSGSGTSREQVDVSSPAAGLYLAVVHGWQTDGPDSNYTLFSWGVGGDMGNMAVSSGVVATIGGTETVDVTWAGLLGGGKYLGTVLHGDGVQPLARTVIEIDAQ